jgi:hypothetical protein
MSNMDRVPPITDDMRRAAQGQPGGWVYVIDPAYDSNGAVPPHGIVGAWRVDGAGNITDEFQRNPNHRPSPEYLGFAAPADPLDEAIQFTATGHADERDVTELVLESEVLVPVENGGDIPVLVIGDRRVVTIFSSESHVPDEARPVRPMRGRDLIDLLPSGVDLQINSASRVRVGIEHRNLPGKS